MSDAPQPVTILSRNIESLAKRLRVLRDAAELDEPATFDRLIGNVLMLLYDALPASHEPRFEEAYTQARGREPVRIGQEYYPNAHVAATDRANDLLTELWLLLDGDGYSAAMAQQRETARAAGKFGGGTTLPAELVARMAPTGFLGYDRLAADGLEVVTILRDGAPVERIGAGDEAIVFLDRTPFYAESGGQVGDTGVLSAAGAAADGAAAVPGFRVVDTRKFAGQYHGHVGRLESGGLAVGDRIDARVDAARRATTVLNHSATHLLHGALRERLGTHVAQKGSLVAPDRLRFDFSHFEPITAEQLRDIELRVNDEVRADHGVEIREMGMQEAIDAGAIALFGEKYGERVRVVKMGDSVELCGGTHVARTGEIGLFKLVSEGGVSAGVRRVEALTGRAALEHVAQEEARLSEAARLLGGTTAEVADKLRALLERQKKLERELESMKAKAASSATADLAASATDIGGIKVLAARIEGLDAKALRDALDRFKQQLGDAVVLLAGASDGRAALVAGVSGAALGRIKAGELLSHVAAQVGGKGGGRPDMAQGGGEDRVVPPVELVGGRAIDGGGVDHFGRFAFAVGSGRVAIGSLGHGSSAFT